MTSKSILQRLQRSILNGNRLKTKDWEIAKEHFKARCVYCGSTDNLVKDHAIPMNAQHLGRDRPGNVVPACRKCNYAKKDRNYIDFCSEKPENRNPAKYGRKAEQAITEFMREQGYKGLSRNKATLEEIKTIIDKARDVAGKERDKAATEIKKRIAK